MRSHSQLPDSVKKKNKNNGESFEELKRLIDEGYERFWDAPHRRGLRPDKFAFGFMDFSKTKKNYEEDYFDDLT